LIGEAIWDVEQRLDQTKLQAITSEQIILIDNLFEKLPLVSRAEAFTNWPVSGTTRD